MKLSHSLFAFVAILTLSACGGDSPDTQSVATPIDKSSDSANVPIIADATAVDDIADSWTSYSNEDFDITFMHPANWNIVEGADVDGSPFIAVKGEGSSQIVILPLGGGGQGINDYKEVFGSLGRFSTKQWVVDGNDQPSVIFLQDYPNGWNSENRIDVFYGQDSKPINMILSSFARL